MRNEIFSVEIYWPSVDPDSRTETIKYYRNLQEKAFWPSFLVLGSEITTFLASVSSLSSVPTETDTLSIFLLWNTSHPEDVMV